jgi:hypothetical protein
MPLGNDDPLSLICDRLLKEVKAQGIFLLARDDEAKTENYSIATTDLAFLHMLPNVLGHLAEDSKRHAEMAMARDGLVVIPPGKYDEELHRVQAELKVAGVILVVFRGMRGTGGGVLGLWGADQLFEAFQNAADKIKRDPRAP